MGIDTKGLDESISRGPEAATEDSARPDAAISDARTATSVAARTESVAASGELNEEDSPELDREIRIIGDLLRRFPYMELAKEVRAYVETRGAAMQKEKNPNRERDEAEQRLMHMAEQVAIRLEGSEGKIDNLDEPITSIDMTELEGSAEALLRFDFAYYEGDEKGSVGTNQDRLHVVRIKAESGVYVDMRFDAVRLEEHQLDRPFIVYPAYFPALRARRISMSG